MTVTDLSPPLSNAPGVILKLIRNLALTIATGAMAFVLSSCGGGIYYAGVSVGPPAPIVEAPYGYAPGPGYVWTPGYYGWVGGNWAWTHGQWRRRPHPIDRWIPPTYVRYGNGYRYHPGGWQHGHHFHQ